MFPPLLQTGKRSGRSTQTRRNCPNRLQEKEEEGKKEEEQVVGVEEEQEEEKIQT